MILYLDLRFDFRNHSHPICSLMNRITLPTCSIMRKVNNDMLSDVLFYFTSFHGQTVLNIVARELNRLYHKYRETHPHFSGKVAIVGHSLGGIITYDLLSNQVKAVSLDGSPISYPNTDPDARNNATHYPIIYPKLDFEPCHLFALGSPVGAVLIMRGQTFPYYSPQTKTEFHNIFHLYDPMVCILNTNSVKPKSIQFFVTNASLGVSGRTSYG